MLSLNIKNGYYIDHLSSFMFSSNQGDVPFVHWKQEKT